MEPCSRSRNCFFGTLEPLKKKVGEPEPQRRSKHNEIVLSQSRLKIKFPGAGAALKKDQEPKPLGKKIGSRSRKKIFQPWSKHFWVVQPVLISKKFSEHIFYVYGVRTGLTQSFIQPLHLSGAAEQPDGGSPAVPARPREDGGALQTLREHQR